MQGGGHWFEPSTAHQENVFRLSFFRLRLPDVARASLFVIPEKVELRISNISLGPFGRSNFCVAEADPVKCECPSANVRDEMCEV